ncbi:MAG: SNF2-related protein [Actinomycetes bacterium]
MVELPGMLEDADLRRRYGAVTLERAWDYVRSGRVLSAHHDVDSDGDLDLRGTVAGTGAVPYSTYVAVGQDERGLWVHSRCSCPVAESCKHAVALLLTVRQAQEQQAGAGSRRWERQLGCVLDELDAPAGGPRPTPLALQVELSRPVASRAYPGWSQATTPVRGGLRLRPLQRGARDRWVRTGISWQQLPQLAARRRGDDQAAVLAEMLTSYRSASGQGYYGGETHLLVEGFGASLWGLLERARAAGVPLVPGQGVSEVAVRTEPVTVTADVNAPDGEPARLALGVRVDEEWYSSDELDVLGPTGHGVALWAPPADPAGGSGASWSLTLAPLDRPIGPAVRRLLGVDGVLVVPATDREDLVADYLPRLRRHLPVTSSDGTVDLPEPAEPRLALHVTWVSVEEVRIAWSWRYRVGDDDREYRLDETRGLRGVRRPDLERALVDGLTLDAEAVHRLCDAHRREHGLVPEKAFTGTDAIAFAVEVLPALEAAGEIEITEVGGRPDYREARDAPVVRFASRDSGGDGADGELLEERTDWLDLEVIISVDGESLALAHLLEALTLGKDRVILRNGVHIRVDRPEFKHLAELVAAAAELQEQPRDGVRIGHHDLGLWDELAEVGLVDAQAEQWVRAAQGLRSLDTLPEVDPTGLAATLRPYQLEGFRWLAFLWSAGLGGVLADDMGLGKTLQTLALVAHARARGAGPFLVVAPTSVVSTWAHEAATFTPGLTVRTVTESRSRRGASLAEAVEGADVVITSYTLYRLEVDGYAAQPWGGLVLDEAQTVKNHQGKTYQAVRLLDVPFRLALTGTPLENRLMELWSLLSIVAPGLYPWPQRFAETVANPVERLGDHQVLDRFRRRIRPFLLRRTKEHVAADLPAKQEQVLEVRLTPRHRRIYETHLQRERQTVLGLVEDFDKHRIAIFRSLTRLRQLALDAALVDPAHEGVGSAKVDVLVDHLVELAAEGHRALVFSQFTSFLTRVRDRLAREGLTSVYLDGRTRRRGDVVARFKEGDAPVFLISLKAGGVGLTLTEADYVFVLDPWWNPAVEAQAVDRAHRIGQRRPVMVYRLVAEQTIEEKVMELKARKAALFAQVVDGDGVMAQAIGPDDVRALFAE